MNQQLLLELQLPENEEATEEELQAFFSEMSELLKEEEGL